MPKEQTAANLLTYLHLQHQMFGGTQCVALALRFSDRIVGHTVFVWLDDPRAYANLEKHLRQGGRAFTVVGLSDVVETLSPLTPGVDDADWTPVYVKALQASARRSRQATRCRAAMVT
jgi:hypothetical protein